MPNANKIRQTMLALDIPGDIMAQFDFTQEKGNRPEPLLALVARMDELLTSEQRLAVMEQQGCCKTGSAPAAHRAFGRANADKTLEEKIALLPRLNSGHKAPCHLNPDGTLSVYWGFGEPGNYRCVCSAIKKLPENTLVSPTYCACCGGHIRHNYQLSLGVRLRLISVVSSPISTGGHKRCEFMYEIIP